jgi:hypothetical protein
MAIDLLPEDPALRAALGGGALALVYKIYLMLKSETRADSSASNQSSAINDAMRLLNDQIERDAKTIDGLHNRLDLEITRRRSLEDEKTAADNTILMTREQIAREESFLKFRKELMGKIDVIGADVVIIKVQYASDVFNKEKGSKQ